MPSFVVFDTEKLTTFFCSVAMFVGALLCCCPRMWVSIFSTGKRASKSLLVQIKEVISSVPTMDKRVISSNVEELWVQPINTKSKKDQSRCYSYPSSVKGLKGVSAKVIVMEEASRLSTDVFYEVVVPLLGVNNTAVLGISTPLGEDNYYRSIFFELLKNHLITHLSVLFYSALTTLKDENERPLFRSLSVELVCPVCKKKDENQVSCVHRMDVLPPWKSQNRQEKVRRIMESVPELFLQEAMGVVVSSRNGVFTKAQVESLRNGFQKRERVDVSWPIFICIDPTGGGSSKLALVSFAVYKGNFIVVSYITIYAYFLFSKPVDFCGPYCDKIVDVGNLSVCTNQMFIERLVQSLHSFNAGRTGVSCKLLKETRQSNDSKKNDIVFSNNAVTRSKAAELFIAVWVQV